MGWSLSCVSIRSSARAGPATGRYTEHGKYFDWFKFQFWRFVFFQQIITAERGKRMAEAASKAPTTNRSYLYVGWLERSALFSLACGSPPLPACPPKQRPI